MKFTLNSDSVISLLKKVKLYNYLRSQLKTSTEGNITVKVQEDSLTLFCKGSNGAYRTVVPVEALEGDAVYFEVDISKWQTALQKLASYGAIDFEITPHLLRIYIEGTDNEINLGIVDLSADRPEVEELNSLVASSKASLEVDGKTLVADPFFIRNLQFANTLPISDEYVISFNAEEICYADRLLVLKAKFETPYDSSFFSNLDEYSPYVKLHSSTAGLIALIGESNPNLLFSSDYSVIYWADEDTEILFKSDMVEMDPPTEDEFSSFKPQDPETLSVGLGDLLKGIDFFTGMYDGHSWKPLTVDCCNGGAILRYVHPTTQLKRTLENAVSSSEMKFMVEAEIFRKVLDRIYNYSNKANDVLTFEYDDDLSRGVYCCIPGKYEIVFAKLIDGVN